MADSIMLNVLGDSPRDLQQEVRVTSQSDRTKKSLLAIGHKNQLWHELDALQLQALKLKHARRPLPGSLIECLADAEGTYQVARGESDRYRVLVPKAMHAAST